MSEATSLFKRAKRIYKTEGIAVLVRRAFSFVFGRFFFYRAYYLYEQPIEDIGKLNDADFMPKINDFTLKIISTNQEADELEADGLEFRSQVGNARERLDSGAVAFCIFVGRELANIV
ncbi:MAG: hypothetical protein KAT75_10945, partial [Dehalococcoidia bacterium]|nr:hypothetical protein [Dehalococcoidia bacterium]